MSKENREIQIIGKALVGSELLECSILIKDERIANISKLEHSNVKTLRFGQGYLIIPAMIDLHVHFRDWGQSYKETIESASMAALAGGITTVLDMPNTVPPVNNLERIIKRYEDFKKKALVDFGLHSKPIPIEDLKEARKLLFGFKFYEEDLPSIKDYVGNLKRDKLVFHAQFGEDEVSAVEFILNNSRELRNVRFAHISRKESIIKIEEFRRSSTNNVFIEVTPHHAFLSQKDLEGKPIGYRTVRPPLASREDNIAIIEAINSGIVDFIATDHAPHSLEEKLSQNPPPGFSSLELVIPIFFTFSLKGIIDLNRLVRCVSYNPAKYLNIKKGLIEEGYYADITIIDTKKTFKVNPSELISMSKFTVFENFELLCKPLLTMLRGKIVYYEGVFDLKDIRAKSIQELRAL